MLDRDLLKVYAVTDRRWLNGRTLREAVEEALKGGVTFVQLREKNLKRERRRAMCAPYRRMRCRWCRTKACLHALEKNTGGEQRAAHNFDCGG